MNAWMYIVLLGLVLVVYARFVPKREPDSKQTNMMKEIESTMEQFSADLEEENRQFLDMVSGMKKEHEVHTARLQGRIEALEQQNRLVSEQLASLSRDGLKLAAEPSVNRPPAPFPASPAYAAVGTDKPVAAASGEKPADRGPVLIRERYAPVFELYQQGKSTEYIAKKLDMNKGEVMLIIQLAKQEDQARV
ncbi:DUF6115 domain-containing protein [Paenibacillus hodogayensis]|uniref:DUF6115 domain-containing protein n=1 Tax=Paenibacillus hodogayensis TaxID=279208 RepID=A0ABV5W3B5_9BACL